MPSRSEAVELELAAARAECRPATADTPPSVRPDALVEIEKIESGMACLPGDAGTLCLPVPGGWAARVVADNAGVKGRTGRWGLKPGRRGSRLREHPHPIGASGPAGVVVPR